METSGKLIYRSACRIRPPRLRVRNSRCLPVATRPWDYERLSETAFTDCLIPAAARTPQTNTQRGASGLTSIASAYRPVPRLPTTEGDPVGEIVPGVGSRLLGAISL